MKSVLKSKNFCVLGFFYLLFFVGDNIFGTRNFFGILEFLPDVVTRPISYVVVAPINFLFLAVYLSLFAPLLCPINSSNFLGSEYFIRSCDDFTSPGIVVVIFIHIILYLALYAIIYRSIKFIRKTSSGNTQPYDPQSSDQPFWLVFLGVSLIGAFSFLGIGFIQIPLSFFVVIVGFFTALKYLVKIRKGGGFTIWLLFFLTILMVLYPILNFILYDQLLGYLYSSSFGNLLGEITGSAVLSVNLVFFFPVLLIIVLGLISIRLFGRGKR